MDRTRGFTLIEAAICLLVGGILLAVAVPAFADAMARTRAASARADLLATLSRGTTHAANTATEVVLCPGSEAGCLDSMDWSPGWIAYADIDGNRRRTPGEPIVHHVDALHEDVRLRSTKGRKRLVLQPHGGTAGSNVTFTLCDRRGAEAAVTLVLANNGRLRDGEPKRQAAQGCVAALRSNGG